MFAGWLADLKEHKTITEWKGTSGIIGCLQCSNFENKRGRRSPNTIGAKCYNVGEFKRRTREDIWAITTELDAEKPRLNKTRFKALETKRGINYCPQGILWDTSLRHIYDPVEHIIVDWQHTFVSDGVANTCIWTLLSFLGQEGFPQQSVRDFLTICHMPSKYGKPDPAWLHPNRLKGTTLSSFSNAVLQLMPILFLYVDLSCSGNDALKDAVACCKMMYTIVGVLAPGPEEAPQHCDLLQRLLSDYHKLFNSISDDRKPKLHHMHHVIQGMMRLGKLLSCFVCERKHRTVKDSALHVFRHIEHTVVYDLVNKQCEQLFEGVDLFQETFLINPRQVDDIPFLARSPKAVLKMGSLHTGDIIWIANCRCGRIKTFYELHHRIFAHMDLFRNSAGDPAMFDERCSTDIFIDAEEIVDACTWYEAGPGIIKVAIPPIALLKI